MPGSARALLAGAGLETLAVRVPAHADALALLRAALRRDGVAEVGEPRLARYDPPWTPWFMRRNEAQVPIAGESA